MSTAQPVAGRCRDEIIADAIRRERQLVLTLQTIQGWRTYRSEFTSGSVESGVFCVNACIPRDVPASCVPEPGQTLGVTFRLNHKKCMLSTLARSIQRQDDGAVITLAWPNNFQQLQRRAYERAAPPKGDIVPVRFWPDDSPAASKGNRNVHYGQLEDLSAGGLRIRIAAETDIQLGGSYKCVFAPRHGAPSLILDATLRHREAADGGRAALGFHFVGLETTPEGRETLNRLAAIVSQYKRTGRRRPPTG